MSFVSDGAGSFAKRECLTGHIIAFGNFLAVCPLHGRNLPFKVKSVDKWRANDYFTQ
jgi:hypothetical protein